MERQPKWGELGANRLATIGFPADYGYLAPALEDYLKAIKIDEEAVGGPGFGTVILNYKFKSSSVKERAIYIYEQLQLPEDERVLKIKELDEGQVMHKPGKL